MAVVLSTASSCASTALRRDAASARDPFLQGAQVVPMQEASTSTRLKNLFSRNKDSENASATTTADAALSTARSEARQKTAREAMATFEKAEAAYKAGQFDEAEELFQTIVKKLAVDEDGLRIRSLRTTFLRESRASHYLDGPLREDSLYLLAEAEYQQKKLPEAADHYRQLLKEYPATRYSHPSAERLYAIGTAWLGATPATTGNVILAEQTAGGQIAAPQVTEGAQPNDQPFVNFTDKTKPSTDINGHALESLRAVWTYDPLGPLADDALMVAAGYHLSKSHFEDAAELYRLLREEYPQSEYLRDAYVLSAHVTQASYQGPRYDGKTLDEARQLKQVSLSLFPDLTPEQRSRLQQEIRQIDHAEVGRDYDRAVFYMRKQRFDAVMIYCNQILNTAPDSPYAEKARALIARIPEESRRNAFLAVISDGLSGRDPGDLPPAQTANSTTTLPRPDSGETSAAPEEESGLRKMMGTPVLRPISWPRFGRQPESPAATTPPAEPASSNPPSAGAATPAPSSPAMPPTTEEADPPFRFST